MAGGRTSFWSGIPSFALALSVYNKTIFNALQGQERSSKFDADQETTRATWDAANQYLYSVLFFTTAGSAFSVVRRFQGKTPAEGAGYGQQAWAALHERFDGCSRAAIRAEHIRMTSTRTRPGQDPDDYLYHMDNCRVHLNACDPPEGPTNRQYEDIILQALPSEYDPIRQTHLERSRLRPCRNLPYDSDYLREQLFPSRIIKRHHGTRRRNEGGGPGPH